MTADDVAGIVTAACTGHHQVRDTRQRPTSFYRDRVAVDLVTTDGATWRIHVLTDALGGGGR